MCRNVKCIWGKKGHSDSGVQSCSPCVGSGLFPRELYFIYVYGSSWAQNRKVFRPRRVISEVRFFRFYFVLYVSVVFHPSYKKSIATRVGLNHFENYFLNHIKSCPDKKKRIYVDPSYFRSLDQIVHSMVKPFLNTNHLMFIRNFQKQFNWKIELLEKTKLGKN